MRRRGFTLVELMVVLCVMGILATVAIPKTRDARERAQATALLERAHAVQVALTALNDRSADVVSSRRGIVPTQLVGALNPDFFQAEANIQFALTRSGGGAVLVMFSSGPASQRVLTHVHRQAAVKHRFSRTVIFYPLDEKAETRF